VILTGIYQSMLNSKAAAWDKGSDASFDGKVFICLSALGWTLVTIFGRLTAYLSTLYIA
jgi:hypothetical protein